MSKPSDGAGTHWRGPSDGVISTLLRPLENHPEGMRMVQTAVGQLASPRALFVSKYASKHLFGSLGIHPREEIQTEVPQQRRSAVLGPFKVPHSCCHPLIFLSLGTDTWWLACSSLGTGNMPNPYGLAKLPVLKDSQQGMLRDSFGGVSVSGSPFPNLYFSPVFPCLPLPLFVTGWQQESDAEPTVYSTTAVDRAGLDALVPPGAGMDIPSNATTKAQGHM